MGLPDEPLCVELDVDVGALANLSVDFLGVAEISATLTPGDIPNGADLCSGLLAQLSATLAPLLPLFRLIDVALCLFTVVDEIPDAFGPPIDPSGLIQAIVECAIKVDFLLQLIPQVSFCVTLRGVLSVIIDCLTALRDQLAALATFQLEIDAGQARVTALAALGLDASLLSGSLSCAQANLQLEADALAAGTAPINRVIGVLNVLTKIAGLPEIPTVEDVDVSAGIELEPLEQTIAVLTGVRDALPC